MSQSERRFSFEFFPAKTEAGHEKLLATARNLAGYKPTSSPAPTAPADPPATAR